MSEDQCPTDNNFVTPQFSRMEGEGPLPDDVEKLVMLDVEFKSAGRKLEVSLGGAYRELARSNQSIEADVQRLVANSPQAKNFRGRGRGNNPNRLATAMSLRCKERIYIIYRLDENSNLRFTIDHYAFTQDACLPKSVFTHARRIDKKGNILPDEAISQSPVRWEPGIRHAMFLFDGRKRDSHVARFNIHLDAVEEDVAHSIKSTCAPYIPIIVDPDVRFPGGNEGP